MSVQDLQQLLLTYSLLLPRIISCFVVLPVLAKQTLGGGLVRNGVACSLALFAYPIVAGSLPPALDALDIALLIGRKCCSACSSASSPPFPSGPWKRPASSSTTSVARHSPRPSTPAWAARPAPPGCC